MAIQKCVDMIDQVFRRLTSMMCRFSILHLQKKIDNEHETEIHLCNGNAQLCRALCALADAIQFHLEDEWMNSKREFCCVIYNYHLSDTFIDQR